MSEKNELDNEIFFSVNVQSGYQYVEGLGGYEFKRYILPVAAVVIAVAIIPPYASVLFWIIKILIALIAVIFCIFMITIKPVQTRKNINLEQWIKWQLDYNKRQKIFFVEKKDKTIYGK